MQEQLADLVYPVLMRGLELKERLEAGESASFEAEQGLLKGLLLTEAEARHLPDFGGDGDTFERRNGGVSEGTSVPPADRFLGIRYVLACWLDELFILDSPWEAQWNEQKLEVALYGTNDRAWKFWEQARLAEKRSGNDALEAFFLCVMLGFRGGLAAEPARLQSWVAAAASIVGREHGRQWAAPPELEPATRVPPLRARQRLQRALLAGGVLLLLLVPAVAAFLVQQLGQ
jgi:type VI secretion system protein ImpK